MLEMVMRISDDDDDDDDGGGGGGDDDDDDDDACRGSKACIPLGPLGLESFPFHGL